MDYIYNTCFGVFVFNSSFKVVDKLKFKDPAKSSKLIDEGVLTDEAKKLQQKYKAEILEEPNEKALRELRQYSKDYYEASMKIIKVKLRESISEDHLIIQTINNVDELSKIINVMVKRLREWYELYCPEFSKSIESNEQFAKLVSTKSKQKLLESINETESFGGEFQPKDLNPIKLLATKINDMYEFKKMQEDYLEHLMKRHCPNVTEIAGFLIGAKLISLAGSLKRLMRFPASTVQLLGAEKALFRHMKNAKFKAPKYGVIMQHIFVSQAPREKKGKAARLLADKISIAVKVDFFKGAFIGLKLRLEIEKKLNNL